MFGRELEKERDRDRERQRQRQGDRESLLLHKQKNIRKFLGLHLFFLGC